MKAVATDALATYKPVADGLGIERQICGSKIRYETMRGYKSVEGMMNGLWLTQ